MKRLVWPRNFGELVLVIVAGFITVRSGDREEFLSLSAEAVAKARAAHGCLDFSVSPDILEAERVNIFEKWDSSTDLLNFRENGPSDRLTGLIVSAKVIEYEVG